MDATRDTMLAALDARFPGVSVGAGAAPDLHLYHAPNSICSQKVRAVLAHRRMAHVSHLLDIFAGDTYDPAYVRVRMAGCRAADLRLADRHPGSTSVATGGCDACVVPTLVDAANGAIVVDSLNICLTLDARATDTPSLIPDALRAAIMAELSVIDELPNYQNLAIKVVSAAAPRNAFATSKVARCNTLLASHGDDPVLRAAYEAKRAKEQNAADSLFDAGSLAAARQAVADALAGLQTRLAAAPGPFLFGDQVTMADLFWGCELLRVEEVGDASLWQGGALPAVEGYLARLSTLPALRMAIIDFPRARMKPGGH